MFWLFDSIFLCALKKLCKVTQTRAECKTKNEVFGFAYAECRQTYEKLVQGERKSKLVFDFSEPPPNFGLSKVTQTRAECKTKNKVFGFAYAECRQTYPKLRKREQNTKRNRRFRYRTIVLLVQVA